jgi:hypothetical protein
MPRKHSHASVPVGDKLTDGIVKHFNNSLPHALHDLVTAFFQYQ